MIIPLTYEVLRDVNLNNFKKELDSFMVQLNEYNQYSFTLIFEVLIEDILKNTTVQYFEKGKFLTDIIYGSILNKEAKEIFKKWYETILKLNYKCKRNEYIKLKFYISSKYPS